MDSCLATIRGREYYLELDPPVFSMFWDRITNTAAVTDYEDEGGES